MQLSIIRSQTDKRGMLGGHKGVTFSLQTRVIFSAEEQQLIEHYKMWDYSVFKRGGMPVTLRDLAQGQSETLENVEILLNNEEVTKDALDSIPPLLQVLRSFGGEEVIIYPRGDKAQLPPPHIDVTDSEPQQPPVPTQRMPGAQPPPPTGNPRP